MLLEEECSRKWKYLRDKYLKERRAEKEKWSGAEGGSHKKWKFMAIMSFLEPHVKERPTTSNCSFDTGSQDCTVESLLLPVVSQVEVGRASPRQCRVMWSKSMGPFHSGHFARVNTGVN